MQPLGGSGWTTDAGWGCMVRTAQMLLAHAWQRALGGPVWADLSLPPTEQPCHPVVLRWFSDLPMDWHPFSMHQVVNRGKAAYGMRPGEWYGPHKVALVMRDLLARQARQADGFVRCAVAQDATVFIDQLHELCVDASREGSTMQWESALMLWVPLRLGLGPTIDPAFVPFVRRLLSDVPQCVGIVGGTPRHSLYFVGVDPSGKLLYLDPHTTQPAPRGAGLSEGGRSTGSGRGQRAPSDGSGASTQGSLLSQTREAASQLAQRAAAVTGFTGWLDEPAQGRAGSKGSAATGDAPIHRSRSSITASSPRAAASEDGGAIGRASSSLGRSSVASGSAMPMLPPLPLAPSLTSRIWRPDDDAWVSDSYRESFHFKGARVPAADAGAIDPSLAVGFFCRDAEDCESMARHVAEAFRAAGPGGGKGGGSGGSGGGGGASCPAEPPFTIERRTPAWMLRHEDVAGESAAGGAGTAAGGGLPGGASAAAAASAIETGAGGGAGAGPASRRAVPTYREAFGMPPLSAPRAAVEPAAASGGSPGKPPRRRFMQPGTGAGSAAPAAHRASPAAVDRAASAGVAGWERVPREVEEDPESGFQVVSMTPE
ncbi:ATG4D [Symbiodinium sp. KB8]|nr:ATG4D [Symbiodinium sp. KB8]